MSALNLYEAYTQVYDDSTLEFDDILTDEDLEIIEELDDETLEDLVDEVISDLIIDEECEIEEIEGIFEEVLSEARIDMAARAKARQEYAKSSEADARSARKAGDAVVRKEKRAAAINRVKRAVKSGVERAKSAVKSGVNATRELVDNPARHYAAKRGIVHKKTGGVYKSADWIKSQKQSTSSGRREVRSKVAADLLSRAKDAVTSRVNAAKSAAKTTVKKTASKAARHVAAAAANTANRAGKFAQRMAEDVDLYDVVLEYLLDEGYADTVENAEVIMVNMSEDWREDIIDEAAKDQSNKQLDKSMKTTYKAQNTIDNRHQGRMGFRFNSMHPSDKKSKLDRMETRLKNRRKEVSDEKHRRAKETLEKLSKYLKK